MDPCEDLAYEAAGMYGNMLFIPDKDRHHANQQAGFPGSSWSVPFDRGAHRLFHDSLRDKLWRPSRRANKWPTIGQYDKAVRQAFGDAGCAPELADAVADFAKTERDLFGLKDSDKLPAWPYPNISPI